ncbi:TRAP transporter large permease [Vreelandella populi]|uniref:TRAP transporter large permease protein n=1 Tax=Vreelandella populi TaxID=2498858 RepID=A0A3S0WLE2_9GAMM|nr:TRAP transporter large permease [Halomonas populi]RUR43597.1 TRAP transporter large permease [Halomonas populi]
MSSLATIAIIFLAAIILIAIRLPIGLVLVTVAFFGVMWETSFEAALGLLANQPYELATNWQFAAAPMFMFMGYVAARTGLTSGLFDASRVLLARVPGSLAVSSVMASGLFAAASGSSVATSASMSRIAVPEMLKRGYDQGLACGSVGASGTLGSLIPPSLVLILFGIYANVSIGQLFLAGFIPGILSALIYMAMIIVRVKLRPELAGTPVSQDEIKARSLGPALWAVLPLPILILLVMGSIATGFATPTESGALGAGGAVLLSFINRTLTLRALREAFRETAIAFGAIFFILVGGGLLVRFVALSGISYDLLEFFAAIDGGPLALILLAALVYLVLGMFVDPIGLMLLTIPIFLPLANTMDINLVWFGIIIVKLLEIGLITPPVGLNIYVIKSTLGNLVDIQRIFRGVTWFIAMDILTLAILIAFPAITLWLPELMQ